MNSKYFWQYNVYLKRGVVKFTELFKLEKSFKKARMVNECFAGRIH